VSQRPVAALLVASVLARRPQEEDDPGDDPDHRHDRAEDEDGRHTGILPDRRGPKCRETLRRRFGLLDTGFVEGRPVAASVAEWQLYAGTTARSACPSATRRESRSRSACIRAGVAEDAFAHRSAPRREPGR
jgi:hypothetical protein